MHLASFFLYVPCLKGKLEPCISAAIFYPCTLQSMNIFFSLTPSPIFFHNYVLLFVLNYSNLYYQQETLLISKLLTITITFCLCYECFFLTSLFFFFTPIIFSNLQLVTAFPLNPNFFFSVFSLKRLQSPGFAQLNFGLFTM